MADGDGPKQLPERIVEGQGPDGAASAPSKNALKKAAKEKEKAEKAAKRKAAEDAQKAQAEADDVSKHDYSDLPLNGSAAYVPPHDHRRTLQEIAEQYTENTSFEDEPGGPKVIFRATVENAREQSAKLTFLVLRNRLDTIQAVVAASEEISRQMVKYFERDAFLAQSPQFHKQMLIAAQFERVFEIGPVFRAENSNTGRHLTEFTGLDLEMAIEETYHEVLDVLEDLMLHIFRGLRLEYAKETELVRQTYHVEDFKLPAEGQKALRLHYSEGVAMLRQAGQDMGDFDDLTTAQEKLLGKVVLEKYGSDFYILDQYPLAVRPFYTMPSSSPAPSSAAPGATAPNPAAIATAAGAANSPPTGPYSNSFDFHMRGVEILSGAQRVHNAELLQQRMKSQDPPVNPEHPGLKEYVDSFRHGCPPHGGAGLGLERIVMLWLGLPNVRLASLFPRDPGRLAP